MEVMQGFRAGQALTLEVTKKGGKAESVEVVLGSFPDEIPTELPKGDSTKKQALVAPKAIGPMPKKEEPKKEEPKKEEPKKEEGKKEDKPKTGLQKIENVGNGQRNFWVFVPDTYDPNVSHGLIVWLHPAGKDGRDADDMVKVWEVFCERHTFIMVGPTAGQPTGWVGRSRRRDGRRALGANLQHDRS